MKTKPQANEIWKKYQIEKTAGNKKAATKLKTQWKKSISWED